MADREHDLILYGATGFTGRLVAEHLLRRAPEGLRWAMAGRDADKLRRVAGQIGAEDIPVVVADSSDAESIRAMAASTRVVCTTVGPYAQHGSPVVAACAAEGTDYCDLTGEVQWIRRMLDAHEAEAEASGARIVFCCGFDSIPSDLGVLVAQTEMQRRHDTHASVVKMGVRAARGGASGGTIQSLVNVMAEAERDPEVRRIVFDPDALMPEEDRRERPGTDARMPQHDADLGAWTGPFVMAVINTRVVRRSNALLGHPWGRDFSYEESVLTGSGPVGAVKAWALAGGMGAAMAGLAIGPIRDLANRFLPGSGDGPDEQARERGFFDLRVHAAHPTDPAKDVRVTVRGDRDPGYGSTSRMLGEAALALAAGEATVGGGMWTPASALGMPLVERLGAHAGVTFTPS